jgi:hypothetical protein
LTLLHPLLCSKRHIKCPSRISVPTELKTRSTKAPYFKPSTPDPCTCRHYQHGIPTCTGALNKFSQRQLCGKVYSKVRYTTHFEKCY